MENPGSRTSTIPRPGLSKLPAPRSALPTPAAVRPVTPATRPYAQNITSPTKTLPRSLQAPASSFKAPAAKPPSAFTHRPKTSSLSGFSYQTPKRQSSVSYPPVSYTAPKTDLNLDTNGLPRSARASSWEGNGFSADSSPSETYSSPQTPADGSVSPLAGAGTKKSRPSLSDRTIESLSHVPPSPGANARRRSSLFQTPTSTAPRPSSQLGQSATRRPSYGTVKVPTAGLPRPASPTKRPTSGIPAGAGNRSSMLAKPRPTPARSTTTARNVSPTKRQSMIAPPATHARTTSTVSSAISQPRTINKGPARGAASLDISKPKTAPQSAVKAKPVASARVKSNPKPAPAPATPAKEIATAEPSSTSSAAFREQIAKAKAERRAALTKSMAIPTSSQYNFEDVMDPFAQNKSDGKEELRKKLDDARRDGRLNIMAMNLKEIPIEVMQMYDAQSMNESNVPWNECIDLVRFNAADNEIAEIGSDVFPDVALDAFADDGEAKTNQFGGVEILDLRGNQLTTLPIGLRRLDHLTSINLSRNKLENWCFEVICQIPHLRELNLSNNSLTFELPATIGMLHELESLDVHSNKLTGLPSSVKNLKKLRSLNVSDNRISDLGADRLSLLPLTELYASSNALTGALFPPSVTQVSRLQILSIANNSIAALGFAPTLLMPSLRRLDVSCNRLFMLPDLTGWTCLTNILCEENCLESLPEGFARLEKLKSASFDHNNIRQLVEGIKDMDSLEFLSLSGNTIKPTKYMSMPTEQLKLDLARKAGFDGPAAQETIVEEAQKQSDTRDSLASSPDQSDPLGETF